MNPIKDNNPRFLLARSHSVLSPSPNIVRPLLIVSPLVAVPVAVELFPRRSPASLRENSERNATKIAAERVQTRCSLCTTRESKSDKQRAGTRPTGFSLPTPVRFWQRKRPIQSSSYSAQNNSYSLPFTLRTGHLQQGAHRYVKRFVSSFGVAHLQNQRRTGPLKKCGSSLNEACSPCVFGRADVSEQIHPLENRWFLRAHIHILEEMRPSEHLGVLP